MVTWQLYRNPDADVDWQQRVDWFQVCFDQHLESADTQSPIIA